MNFCILFLFSFPKNVIIWYKVKLSIEKLKTNIADTFKFELLILHTILLSVEISQDNVKLRSKSLFYVINVNMRHTTPAIWNIILKANMEVNVSMYPVQCNFIRVIESYLKSTWKINMKGWNFHVVNVHLFRLGNSISKSTNKKTWTHQIFLYCYVSKDHI